MARFRLRQLRALRPRARAGTHGVLFRAAGYEAAADDVLAQIEAPARPGRRRRAALRRRSSGQRRAVRLARVRRRRRGSRAFCSAGDTRAEAWIKTAAAGRAAGAGLRPPAAGARRQGAGGGAVARQAGLQLLRRDARRPSRAQLAGVRRHRRRQRLAALQGSAAMRHQLRLLRARTASAWCARACRRPPEAVRMNATSAHNRKSSGMQDNRGLMGNQPVHQGNRPRQGRRAVAQPRAGRRPVRPGARRHGDRPGNRRLLPGHAHQGRDARGDGGLPRRDACARCTAAGHATSPLVVLPSYNGARKLPVLTPLLALLLAREGLPVLVHGTATESTRVLRVRSARSAWRACA